MRSRWSGLLILVGVHSVIVRNFFNCFMLFRGLSPPKEHKSCV